MKLQDATDIKLGTTSASKVMLGDTQVWPKQQLPYELQYKSVSEGGWGNHYLHDGDILNLTGTYQFGMWTPQGDNITYNYTWTTTSNITLVDVVRTDVGDPRGDNLPLIYKYKITGNAVLTITDNTTGTDIITVTFNQ
jgi:hypothetical protein